MKVIGRRPEVLVSDGGVGQARSTLATVRSLARAGYAPVVTTSGRYSVAAASRFCVRSVDVPKVSDAGYAPAIRAELASGRYLTFLAAGDEALLALGADVRRWVDKSMLAKEAESVGLESAPGRAFSSIEELVDARNQFEYPAVVKPTRAGGRVRYVASAGEVAALPRLNGGFVVQSYLSDGMRAMGGVISDGKLIAAVHQRYLRTWPSDCGGACAAETVEPDTEMEKRLVELMDGFEGVFQAQFAGDYLLDLNPRVYGSLPLATRAGVNLPGIFCDALRGKLPGSIVRGRTGVFFRWLEGDFRHLLHGVRTRDLGPRDALQLLRPRPGAAHGPESLKDPKPMFARLAYAAKSDRRRRNDVGSNV